MQEITTGEDLTGLICLDPRRVVGNSRDTTLNWYLDGTELKRRLTDNWQSYLGWASYTSVISGQQSVVLTRDVNIIASEGNFSCHLGEAGRFYSTATVGVFYPSESLT